MLWGGFQKMPRNQINPRSPLKSGESSYIQTSKMPTWFFRVETDLIMLIRNGSVRILAGGSRYWWEWWEMVRLLHFLLVSANWVGRASLQSPGCSVPEGVLDISDPPAHQNFFTAIMWNPSLLSTSFPWSRNLPGAIGPRWNCPWQCDRIRFFGRLQLGVIGKIWDMQSFKCKQSKMGRTATRIFAETWKKSTVHLMYCDDVSKRWQVTSKIKSAKQWDALVVPLSQKLVSNLPSSPFSQK